MPPRKPTVPPAWRNRIIGYAKVPASQLLANPKNFRIHPKFQQDALAAVLQEVGWVQDVIVNQRTGFVVDGHARINLVLSRNPEENVPVGYVDLTDAEEALILATLDPLAALAVTDGAQLEALLREVSTDSDTLQTMLSDLAERSGVIPPLQDAAAEWGGMPEFQQDDQTPTRQIIVSFASEADMADFAAVIGQDISEKAKSIWYPARAYNDNRHLAYIGEDGDAA